MTPTGAGLIRLAEVMHQLRSPGGCPWDAEQTHESLIKYLIEETYETIDAIDCGDRADLREELGDLLLQVFFHARIAEEHPTEPFNIDDVAVGIADKLVRRHPHVFPTADGAVTEVADAADVEARWQQIKNAEKDRQSVIDGVPVSLPPLTHAVKLLTRLDNASQPAPLPVDAAAAISELLQSGHNPADIVLVAIAQMHAEGTDPEAVMRSRVADFRIAIQVQEAQSGETAAD